MGLIALPLAIVLGFSAKFPQRQVTVDFLDLFQHVPHVRVVAIFQYGPLHPPQTAQQHKSRRPITDALDLAQPAVRFLVGSGAQPALIGVAKGPCRRKQILAAAEAACKQGQFTRSGSQQASGFGESSKAAIGGFQAVAVALADALLEGASCASYRASLVEDLDGWTREPSKGRAFRPPLLLGKSLGVLHSS